jgi:predicted MPP superfamily phosphohydrolase
VPRRRTGRSVALRAALYYLLCWSVIAGLVPSSGASRWAVLGLAVATTAPLVAFIVQGGWIAYPTAAFRLFVVRPVLYTQLLLPLVAGAGLLGLLVGTPFGVAVTAGRIAALAVLGLMVTLLAAGYMGSARLVRREVEVTVPGLPAAWSGLRIAQISDLHVGPHSSRRFLARVVDAVAGLHPDLIAVTGDLVDDRAEDVAHFAAGVRALRAPLGVYLIPGNHDVYAGWDEVERRLRESLPEATLLVNDARVLTRDGESVAIVGTGDPAGRRGAGRAAPDIDRALRAVPANTTVVALAHNPALWPALAERGVALTLSGHTHWGQFALPRWGWSLASPFLARAMGAHADGDALLYINPGTGYWGLPFRIGATPEVTLVTLRPGPRAAIVAGRASARFAADAPAFAAD